MRHSNEKTFNPFFYLLALLLFTMGMGKSIAQSSVGVDFWVSFLSIYKDKPSLSLIVTGQRACEGTITNPHTHWSAPFSVSAGSVTSIAIPIEQAYNSNSEGISNTGLHVVSSDSISLFASNYKEGLSEVTHVLPVGSLGSDYMIQTYSGDGGLSSEFIIIATEDNTVVDITLACHSLQGHDAGQTFSVTLDSGQCYQVLSASREDLSGTSIHAVDSKKIAVFSGNICANVPNTSFYGCDPLVEQMMPTNYWGKHFVVTGSSKRDSDFIRVTALNDNCQIIKNGVTITTIGGGQTHQFELTSNEPSAYIETTEPAMVGMYLASNMYDNCTGDPSMVMISPLERMTGKVTFRTFNSGTTDYHFINVVTDSDEVAAMRLDGLTIDTLFKPVAGNSDYAFARIQVEHGPHTLTSLSGGFIAHVYGLGRMESYAYSAGAMARNNSSMLMVNGVFIADPTQGYDVCVNNNAVLELKLDYEASRIDWSWGDGLTSTGNPAKHSYSGIGDFTVVCKAFKNENGNDVLADSLKTVLHVFQTKYEGPYEESSIGPYTWMGHTYEVGGLYEWERLMPGGCESVTKLQLSIGQPIQLDIQGLTEVTASGGLWPGVYNYCLADSLGLENCKITWHCSNPEWVIVPHPKRFWCRLVARTSGQATLRVDALCNSGSSASFSLDIHATPYDLDEIDNPYVILYPNPAQSQVTVRGSQLTQIRVIDCVGQPVKHIACDNAESVTVDLGGVSQGVYLVEITTTVGKTTKRLIVNR